MTPPQDLGAEMAVLGAVLLDSRALDDAIEAGVTGDAFYRPAHGTIWAAFQRLHEAGNPVDAVAVLAALVESGDAVRIGGAVYLHDLVTSVSTAANVGYYARIVLGKALQRRLVEAGMRVAQIGYEGGGVPADLLASAQSEVLGIDGPDCGYDTWSQIADVFDQVMDDADPSTPRTPGIRWGWADVDEWLNPLEPGQLALVVAYSGVGKSIAVGNIAWSAAVSQGRPTLMHGMEMSRLEIGRRMASAAASVPLSSFKARELTEAEWGRLARARKAVDTAPLVIDDDEDVSLASLRSSVRRHHPDLVIVDQVPIMRAADPKAMREQQVAAIAYGLKKLAKAERCAVIAVAQLNSSAIGRADKSPTLHDVRESRALQHAADVGVILHDPTNGEKEDPRAGEIDFVIKKQRDGVRDKFIPLASQTHYARFADLARRSDYEGAGR